ncbi:MAG: hypothetical protein EZS28_026895, partial [Streblomastix strix]
MQQTGEQSVSEVQTPYKDENQHYSKYLQRIKEMKEITTARPKEMRTELAGRTMLKELTEMLQFSRQLQIKEHARNIQTGVCEVICIIMGDNPEAIDLAINKSDIVRELMKLLRDDIPLDEIEVIHISALKSFCAFGRPEHRRELYKLGVQNSIIHFMKSDKPNITLFTSEALYKILSGEWFLMGNKCLHPYFDTFEEQGIIQILFEDGLKGSNCEGTIETSAECLSLLYQQRELPDYMKEKVITQLKKGLHSEDKADIQCSSRGLLCLAQNKGNVDMILADNFLSELEEVIKLSQFGSSDFDKLLQEYLNNLKNHFIKPEYSTQNDNDIDLETDSHLKIKQIKKLGKGGFGEVWLIEEINTKQQMAWKKMDYNTEEERKIVDSEVKILRDQYQNCRKSSQSFVHIVKPLGFLINEKGDKAFLVMEYCPGGDLNSYIKDMISKGTEIAVEKFWEIIGQLISAIFQLHSHGIIHGDLKPSNVLLTNDFRIKLADFGSARELQEGK